MAQIQPCLRHWLGTLERDGCTGAPGFIAVICGRDFWWVYEADSPEQAERWPLHFVRRWARSEPELVQAFWQGFQASIAFLKPGLRTWTYRPKATNLAAGFFRNLRLFLGRFPGLLSPDHADRALGLYLLGAEHV